MLLNCWLWRLIVLSTAELPFDCQIYQRKTSKTRHGWLVCVVDLDYKQTPRWMFESKFEQRQGWSFTSRYYDIRFINFKTKLQTRTFRYVEHNLLLNWWVDLIKGLSAHILNVLGLIQRELKTYYNLCHKFDGCKTLSKRCNKKFKYIIQLQSVYLFIGRWHRSPFTFLCPYS